jgi:hypothetical protein
MYKLPRMSVPLCATWLTEHFHIHISVAIFSPYTPPRLPINSYIDHPFTSITPCLCYEAYITEHVSNYKESPGLCWDTCRKITAVDSDIFWTHYNINIPVKYNCNLRYKVFTAVTMNDAVFWIVTPCGSYKNQRFGGTYRLHYQAEFILERFSC